MDYRPCEIDGLLSLDCQERVAASQKCDKAGTRCGGSCMCAIYTRICLLHFFGLAHRMGPQSQTRYGQSNRPSAGLWDQQVTSVQLVRANRRVFSMFSATAQRIWIWAWRDTLYLWHSWEGSSKSLISSFYCFHVDLYSSKTAPYRRINFLSLCFPLSTNIVHQKLKDGNSPEPLQRRITYDFLQVCVTLDTFLPRFMSFLAPRYLNELSLNSKLLALKCLCGRKHIAVRSL